MEKYIGKIIEVFIPRENNIDIINSKKIGFKVLINKKVIEIIKEQNDLNSYILKDDIVLISKNIINDIEYIDIKKYNGENYE